MTKEKNTKNLLIVTGTFDEASGKPSYFGSKIYEAFELCFRDDAMYRIKFVNGGNITLLPDINFLDYSIIFWMPHIEDGGKSAHSNNYTACIKTDNPTAIFIQAKRNDCGRYSHFEIVRGMFEVHSNLCFVISKEKVGYSFKIYDPLGNIWYGGRRDRRCCPSNS